MKEHLKHASAGIGRCKELSKSKHIATFIHWSLKPVCDKRLQAKDSDVRVAWANSQGKRISVKGD